MTRNPNLPSAIAISDPIRVALLTEDPLLRAGLSSLLAQVGSIDVVEGDGAEVALWDAGNDASKTLAKLAELRTMQMPVVAVVGDPAHTAPAIAAGARGVVLLLSEGLSNKLIADRLGISDHTAKFHVNGVMMKLGASTRTEAVVEAMRRGLIKL